MFHEKVEDPFGYIWDLLQTMPVLCSTDAQLVLRERYETTYGIYNHDDIAVPRPFAPIAMQWSEDSCDGSLKYERIEQFSDFNIYKYFGLNWVQFCDLPVDEARKILEVSLKRCNKEGVITDNLFKDLTG